jgi:hypothetical protein
MRRLLRPIRSLLPGGATLESRMAGGIVRLHRSWSKLQMIPKARVPGFVWDRKPQAVALMNYVLKGNGDANGRTQSKLYERYQQIDQEYIPSPYPGKVVLLWSDGEPENGAAAARWWRKAAAEVEVRLLPASPHQEALARHGEAVGAIIRSCIDSAERSRSGAAR